jgi:hypothetical protein
LKKFNNQGETATMPAMLKNNKWICVLLLVFGIFGLMGCLRHSRSEPVIPSRIFLVDLTKRDYDYDELLLVKTMQGIVNRKHDEQLVYVIHRGAGADGNSVMEMTPGDIKWLNAAITTLGMGTVTVEVEPCELLEMFKNDFSGQVIYDKSKTENVIPTNVTHYWTVPLAVTYAGLYDAVVVSEEIPGLPVLFDFRNNNWTKLEAYEWVIEGLIPKVNREIVFLNDAYTPYNSHFACRNYQIIFG